MWRTTNTPNLLRNDSGTYYARVVHGGRQHWRSLKTKVATVARQRLRAAEEEIRSTKPGKGVEMNFAQAAVLYAADVQAMRLKQTTKDFRIRFEKTLRRSWPDVWTRDVRRITVSDCKEWQRRFESGGAAFRNPRSKAARAADSSTTINGSIAYLRNVFDKAIQAGLIAKNPASDLERKPPTRKLLDLPSREQFAQIVSLIRDGCGKKHEECACLIEGMAYTGMRLSEATALTWTDVSLPQGRIVVRGTKTESAPRIVPLNEKARDLFTRIPRKQDPRVFQTSEAGTSLASACKKVGVPKMTHHDLRHLFATVCIESGVDIPTVSRWLGHADGGTLAMQTYGHLRPSHSVEAAARVKF